MVNNKISSPLAAMACMACTMGLAAPAQALQGSIVTFVDEFKTPGIETELSGIYPHLTDKDLYYVVTNGRPTYRPTMKPMLPEHLRNKLLTVNRAGQVVNSMELPDGGGLFGDLKYGDGHLWLGPLDPPALWKLDLKSGQIVAKFPLPGPAGGFEFDADRSLIVVQNYIGHPQLVIVDPNTGTIVDSTWSDENCQGMAKVGGDLLTVWTSSWDADAYSELWVLDEVTGKPIERIRLEGVHAAMAPLKKEIAGFDGFMTLVHTASGGSGETVIRRYRYTPRRDRVDDSLGRRIDTFAAIQYSPGLDDSNTARGDLTKLVREAAHSGARFVVLPELALSGPLSIATADLLGQAEQIEGPTIRHFADLSRHLGIWTAVPFIERAEPGGSHYYVSIALLDPDGDVAISARKRVLRPNGEDGAALVGFARVLGDTVDDQGRRIGIVSGDDLQSGVPRLAARGADTILASANWSSEDKIDWTEIAERLAKQFNVNLVIANRQPGLGGIFSPTAPALIAEPKNGTLSIARLEMVASKERVQGSLGLPSVPLPSNQPFSHEIVELGRKLFFDKRLSSTREISCASCHRPDQFFSDGRVKGEGVNGRKTRRNVPSLLNVAYRRTLQWDGNPTTIEQQMKYPLTGFAEMNIQSYEMLTSIIAAEPAYAEAFKVAMNVPPQEISREHVIAAIAAYVRTLVSGNSAFDRYYYGGEESALITSAVRGLKLFVGKAGCSRCHRVDKGYSLFTDSQFHNLGIGYDLETKSYADPGVGTVSNSDYSGMFFTPSLRNVAETAPYMHDGSVATLDQAIRVHFASRDPRATEVRPELVPSDPEIRDLVAFLQALTGEERYTREGEPVRTIARTEGRRVEFLPESHSLRTNHQ